MLERGHEELANRSVPVDLTRLAGELSGRLMEWLDPSTHTVNLGVTGLRRSGKTVLLTALVHNLLHRGRLPFLAASAGLRLEGARLLPPSALDIPRFPQEAHLAALQDNPPRWPEPTRGIGQIRLGLRYRPTGTLERTLVGDRTLILDIRDYPGEWLLDLPLLRTSFADWSRETLGLADIGARRPLSEEWRTQLAAADWKAPLNEAAAAALADSYTRYLVAARDSRAGLLLLQPGRFLEPGELAGAPVLAFCPVPPHYLVDPPAGSLAAAMAERYRGYCDRVVLPFMRRHFATLDRQIVLVDLLSAINEGPGAVAELRQALAALMPAFRHGSAGWLSRLIGQSAIDKVLFAATKLDHVGLDQQPKLAELLGGLVAEVQAGLRFEGAEVETMALAALRCTDSVIAQDEQGRPLPSVRGRPVGRDRDIVLFPGHLPDTLAQLKSAWDPASPPLRFQNFAPPQNAASDPKGMPHIGLDHALEFLIGDRLE